MEHINNTFHALLEIDPCGEGNVLVIQTHDRGFIDSSVLSTDNGDHLNCTWVIKVKKENTLMIKAHALEFSNR